VTVAEAERFFSYLGNSLKTWQRSTSNQERLNSLAILSMENELASTVNFYDIITEFVKLKAHKIKFSFKKKYFKLNKIILVFFFFNLNNIVIKKKKIDIINVKMLLNLEFELV
jgi:hypothetical protein